MTVVMAVAKDKATKNLPQKVNRDVVQKYLETAESSRRAIETSKRLTQEARALIERVREKKKPQS